MTAIPGSTTRVEHHPLSKMILFVRFEMVDYYSLVHFVLLWITGYKLKLKNLTAPHRTAQR